ncbi:hypothetical protein C5167_006960 [Papaver somniferum]|uniref:Myb-like domain-containing protein n=1 Tax=Papaver somniferum TaxID=3469 RepID=A0A4Y7JI94_PAPSO|nr:uncharacterized protein LOC113271571 [Papaver somniferum]XP_026377251.1 uncharacterized protein LOC113271571 [Papaver somniferum]XP_026377252.1 uncharacterized protein LOC113271571 [Papaver somniferum]RZC59661.1 hypothetical protein C5167_006960 [Papaver somniferum]
MSSHEEVSEASEGHLEPEEDEDEDVDFNPFLSEAHSPEASSSLSSEDEEDLGTDLVDNAETSAFEETDFPLNLTDRAHYIDRDSENEEVLMQNQDYSNSIELGDATTGNSKKRKLASDLVDEIESMHLAVSSSSKDAYPVENSLRVGNTYVRMNDGESPNSKIFDEEDAICRRTRARYSLASSTLEELETFLQETDDDDDLQNKDDEQEYRKFLAGVLQGGDDEGGRDQENAVIEDDDEENDADFEIEIEEALDSDLDESMQDKRQTEKYAVGGRRPITRQNRSQKVSAQDKKMGQANRPLRPLLPTVSMPQFTPFPRHGGQGFIPGTSYQGLSSSHHTIQVNGFSPHQIGQLHCLIHEHVQLLVQVFSLCVFDPSHQHIANEVSGMISQLVRRRDEVSSWKVVPYPGNCFLPPCTQPSVSDRPSDGRSYEHDQSSNVNALSSAEDFVWQPLTTGPVTSILDVAPLRLVGGYMVDIAEVAKENRQRFTKSANIDALEKEPLFPLPSFLSAAESNRGVLGGCSSGNRLPKKTLAASIVESSKKQPVSLVPKEIAKLVQRFYPLFNSALFPHRPPPSSVVNRVLFTDNEDELLALGMMEYNTDWKAIQQRFLPCKYKHQIFVRQKNRCSSKAPDNSIKAVRRMKTSPLTAEEKARIDEGLGVFKLDWMSVWKFIVPHRDPSLLPRQWRIASGTQKSYKSEGAKKEKRRLYSQERRKSIAAAGSANLGTVTEKEGHVADNVDQENRTGNDDMEDEDEAYVHEAFLADWRPTDSRIAPSNPSGKEYQSGGENHSGHPFSGSHSVHDYANGLFAAPNNSLQSQNVSHVAHMRYSPACAMGPNQHAADWISKSSRSQVKLKPYRARRKKTTQLVQLAPSLPPVNLPASVHVISQSAFKTYCGPSHSTRVPSSSNVGTEDLAPARMLGTSSAGNPQKRNTPACLQGPRFDMNSVAMEEKGSESDLQMHPLLFQGSEDNHSSYCQTNYSTSSSTFSFLPGNHLQSNLNFPSTSQRAGSLVNQFYTSLGLGETPSTTSTIDFHPLLQRPDIVNKDSVNLSGNLSFDFKSFGGNHSQVKNSSGSVHISNSEPASLTGNTNEIDLEIHLSSTPRKVKDMGIRNEKENSVSACVVALDSNCLGEESLPEIVMEQEELSDSEEEIGEDVEFEREEIADSEDDDPNSAQLVETTTKEVQVIAGKEFGMNKKSSAFRSWGSSHVSSSHITHIGSLSNSEQKFVGHQNDRDQASKSFSAQPRRTRLSKRIAKGVAVQEIPLLGAEFARCVSPQRKPRKNVRKNVRKNGKSGRCLANNSLAPFCLEESSSQKDGDYRKVTDTSFVRPTPLKAGWKAVMGLEVEEPRLRL